MSSLISYVIDSILVNALDDHSRAMGSTNFVIGLKYHISSFDEIKCPPFNKSTMQNALKIFHNQNSLVLFYHPLSQYRLFK